MEIPCTRTYEGRVVASIMLAVYALAGLLSAGTKDADWQLMLGGTAILWLLICYAEYIQNSRVVRVLVPQQELRITQTSWFMRRKTTVFALGAFGSVRSYLVPGRNICSCLELVSHGGGEAVIVATYAPARMERRFFSLSAGLGEPPLCASTRKRLALLLGITDAGFLGYRWVGSQLKPGT